MGEFGLHKIEANDLVICFWSFLLCYMARILQKIQCWDEQLHFGNYNVLEQLIVY